MLIRGEAAAAATAAQRSIARDFSYDSGSRMDVFHGENVSLGQRSPIMRIFLFFFFVCVFSVRGEVCINPYSQVPVR
jgi:hypothetical protein